MGESRASHQFKKSIDTRLYVSGTERFFGHLYVDCFRNLLLLQPCRIILLMLHETHSVRSSSIKLYKQRYEKLNNCSEPTFMFYAFSSVIKIYERWGEWQRFNGSDWEVTEALESTPKVTGFITKGLFGFVTYSRTIRNNLVFL